LKGGLICYLKIDIILQGFKWSGASGVRQIFKQGSDRNLIQVIWPHTLFSTNFQSLQTQFNCHEVSQKKKHHWAESLWTRRIRRGPISAAGHRAGPSWHGAWEQRLDALMGGVRQSVAGQAEAVLRVLGRWI
jgi:hypothetical protein